MHRFIRRLKILSFPKVFHSNFVFNCYFIFFFTGKSSKYEKLIEETNQLLQDAPNESDCVAELAEMESREKDPDFVPQEDIEDFMSSPTVGPSQAPPSAGKILDLNITRRSSNSSLPNGKFVCTFYSAVNN